MTIIRAGRTVESGSLQELRQLTRTAIRAETKRRPDLDGVEGIHGLERGDHHVSFDVDGPQLDAAVRVLSHAGIRSLTSTPPTLEELFLRHYGDELSEEAAAS